MNGADLFASDPFRGIIVGYPGGGKTGAIAALANVGYKIRVLDYEGNFRPLLAFTKPEFRKNIDVVTFQDKLANSPDKSYVAPVGIPSAFNRSLEMMMHWKYKNPDGTETDLGKPADWGMDTVIVLDSITGQGEAAFRRAQVMANKTPSNTTQAVWGGAVADQLGMLQIMGAFDKRYHLIALAHLTMIGPQDIDKKDDDLTKEIKRDIAELLPTRLYPKAVTKAFSQTIAKEFPTMLLAEQRERAGKVQRILKTTVGAELDLKFPVANAPAEVPVETGLATLFALMGYKPPVEG
jgi:hypothetical protein